MTAFALHRQRLLVLGLLLFALALRLYCVTWAPMIIDEAKTIIRYVSLPLPEIFNTVGSNNHPLASALAHLFSPTIDNLFMLRWPMILVGMLALPLIYRLGLELFGRRVGLLALLLLAVSPVHWGYSLTVRGYGGLITLSAASFLLLWLAIKHNSWPAWVGFFVSSLLVAWFHLFAVVSVGLQILLASAAILWCYGGGSPGRRRLARLALVTIILLIAYAALVFPQTTTIVTNETWWQGEFAAWGDGQFNPVDDFFPIARLAQLFGLMAPWYIGVVVYVALFGAGLGFLWRQQRFLGVLVMLWFLTPFAVIFVGKQLAGSFYAYVRFLLFLLPAYILLVALGLVVIARFLARFDHGRWLLAVGGAALVMLLAISTMWHLWRTTPINWFDLAAQLSTQIQPDDVVICEEHQRGYLIPDEIRAYCMWMLNLYMPRLDMYSSQFQSTIDYVADYDHIRERREAMTGPGGVWLIIWQKLLFDPGELETAAPPHLERLLSLAAFEPYAAHHFEAATLVHINSEPTLLENLEQTLYLLLRVEPSIRDKSRYYRDLAELAAAQGRKAKATKFFEKSWAAVEQGGGEYPDLFLLDTRPMIERLPDSHRPPTYAFPVNQKLADALCLAAFEIEPTSVAVNQPVALTLYWRTLGFLKADYKFFLDIQALDGVPRLQVSIEPFDRIYPTPWWWTNQWVIEPLTFSIPPDLPAQDFLVQVGAFDRARPAQNTRVPLFILKRSATGWQVVPAASTEEVTCGSF